MDDANELQVRLDLTDSTAVGVVDVASDGTIVAANDAFGELVGVSNPVGGSFGEMLGVESDEFGRALSSLVGPDGEEREPLDAMIVLPNGGRRYLELRPVARRAAGGASHGTTVTIIDRSARSQAQAEAKRLRAIFEDIGELIGVMAPDGTVLSMNPSALTFFGEQARDRGLLQFVPAEGAGLVLEEILPALMETGRWEGEVDLLRHDGAEIPHHVTLQRHPSDVPDEDYWWAVARDRSLAYKAAEAEALENLNESKDRFIAGVSHELRTPLTTIRGFADILATRPVSEAERSEFVDIIRREAHAMSSIVEDLLVAARFDSGRVTVLTESIDMWQVVDEVARGIPGSDRRVDNRVQPGLHAWGDDLRARQVIRNLVVNTIRHGGSRTWIESESVGGRVLIHVCDDGRGVDPAIEEAIFEPYVSRPNDGRRPESVGLGLTVCRQLARLMNGDVRYSNVGHACFTLDLPGMS